MAEDNVSATLTVAAPAERVFAVLADPTAHAAIDGTGWVRRSVDRAPLTEVGQIFRMDMYHPNHPDGGYQTVNKVQVLGPPRTIGWLTGYRKDDGELDFGGWIWRYDLAPLGPSETEVTLTYDWSAVPQHIREYIQCSRRSARSISPTRCTTWPGSSRNEDAGRGLRRPSVH
ncbi:SRPBCC domain-containing protein [Streptomyces sp. NPDC005356]|uniref:SRPBCC domain-containing protein n=1 Tax=Streptomyces sp. NPDC005356 TaxID=3157167 RepID=UPI0033B35C95